MRKKYSETETQAAERYIKECRECAALFPMLRRAFLAFDGKMYNKRLETALQAENRRIYCEKKQCQDYFNIGIYMFTKSGEYVCLCWCRLADDKRIKASDFIQAAENKRAELLKDADHMAQVLPTIETRRKQIEILQKQLDGVIADLSYTERELFDLHKRISRW